MLEDSNPSGKMRMWVEKTRYYVIRMDVPEGVVEYKTIKLNPQLADEQFEFKPPEGTRRIDAGVPFSQ